MKLMPLGVENLVLVSDETRKQVYEAARRPPDATPKQLQDGTDGPATAAKKEKQWRVGGIEFEALMRMLDNAVSTFASFLSLLLKHNVSFLHTAWFVDIHLLIPETSHKHCYHCQLLTHYSCHSYLHPDQNYCLQVISHCFQHYIEIYLE